MGDGVSGWSGIAAGQGGDRVQADGLEGSTCGKAQKERPGSWLDGERHLGRREGLR